ncbi:MAG: caspase family protein [Saprospiraceae bacterium]
MKTLYTLLIGINNYPIDSHKLNGCINDRDAIHEFFQRYCEANQLNYQPLLLTDEDASRQAIINGFSQFENAKNGDICIFYYSGHGSQMPAPKEFWRDETDRKCETIVCHDSRIGQGRDLADKEISYLIWKATQKKEVHFLAIFDCCHAGTITRNVEVINRMAEENTTPVFAKKFEGVEFYKSQEGQLIPPEGSHITLSASASYESSVELTLDGKRRGLFTYSLIDVLEKSELTTLSYAGLMTKVQTRVHNRIGSQHPQVDAQGEASIDQLFFDGALATNPTHIVKFNEKKGWIMDLGKIHGVTSNTSIKIEHEGILKEIIFQSIDSNQSVLKKENWMQEADEFYFAKEISGLHKKLKIAFFPQLESDQAKQYIHDLVKDWNIEYVENINEAAYWMRLTDRGYILTRPHNERSLFKAIPENDNSSNELTSAEFLFLQNVNKVAQWQEVSELSNPMANGTAEKEIEIDFFCVTDHIDYLTVKPNGEKKMDTNGNAVFEYFFKDGAWENPHIRMNVKNVGNRTLWIGALFLGEDFVITDEFLPVKELKSGDEAYPFTAVNQNGYRVSVVPIFVPDELHSWGETEVSNQIKIIASETPFTMDAFRQAGLELETKPKSRGMGFGKSKPSAPKIPTQPSWFTKDIIYKIHRPQDVVNATSGKAVNLHELIVESHDSFSAEAIYLSSSSNTTRSIQRPSIQAFLGSENFQPVNLQGSTRNIQHGLDTLEMHNVQGKENINAENPLKVKLNLSLEENERIFPFGYDAETKTYYPLGQPDEETNVINVEELPDAEEVVTRGLGKSLKIYLQKVVYQKIFKKEFTYPILAAAMVDEQQNVSRETDYEIIRSKVEDSTTKRILVFIHGIIGDTSGQVKLVRRAVKNENGVRKNLTDIYDLVLTFDYESLNDPIELTAENLKKRLEQIGLQEGHGKTVHIVAHSMGGLVSRWFLEHLDGDKMVSHFIQVGSPNYGSPWANTYHMGIFSLTKLINFLPIPSTINSVLAYLGKKRKKIEVTVSQLQPDSDFCKKLKLPEGKSNIPYTIIAGDSSLIPNRSPQEGKLIKKMLNRYALDYRKKLIKLFFHDRSDDIVAIASCHDIPEGKCSHLEIVDAVGCNHFTYFNTDEGVKQLAKTLFELEKNK